MKAIDYIEETIYRIIQFFQFLKLTLIYSSLYFHIGNCHVQSSPFTQQHRNHGLYENNIVSYYLKLIIQKLYTYIKFQFVADKVTTPYTVAHIIQNK